MRLPGHFFLPAPAWLLGWVGSKGRWQTAGAHLPTVLHKQTDAHTGVLACTHTLAGSRCRGQVVGGPPSFYDLFLPGPKIYKYPDY